MKFLTLMKKELRESMILMILATLCFTVIAGLSIREFDSRGGDDYRYHVPTGNYQVFHHTPVNQNGDLLIFVSISLGLGLGALHFWVPLLTRTWSFLVHRSVSRETILWSKLLCATVAFVVCLGIPWMWAHAHLNHVKATGFPINARVLREGWLFIGLGFVMYLGLALSAMSAARWYTTRFFGVIFAIFVLCWMFYLASLSAGLTLLVISTVILLVQLAVTFSRREF